MRALARDLGAGLGVGGHLTALRRTRVGPVPPRARADAARAGGLARSSPCRWPTPSRWRSPRRDVDADAAADVSHGRPLPRRRLARDLRRVRPGRPGARAGGRARRRAPGPWWCWPRPASRRSRSVGSGSCSGGGGWTRCRPAGAQRRHRRGVRRCAPRPPAAHRRCGRRGPRRAACRRVLITFDPHPAEVVRPGSHPARLTSLRRRADLVAELGVDAFLVLPFTTELVAPARRPSSRTRCSSSACTPPPCWSARNFTFGHRAAGDVALLDRVRRPVRVRGRGRGADHGRRRRPHHVLLDLRPRLHRRRRRRGRGRRARPPAPRRGRGGARLPARPRARVPHRERRQPALHALPADGVYAGRFVLGDRRLPAAVSVGSNPTFSGTVRTVEAYVLDVDEDFYGHEVGVDFVARLRGQERYDDLGRAGRGDRERRRPHPRPCSASEFSVRPRRQFSRSATEAGSRVRASGHADRPSTPLPTARRGGRRAPHRAQPAPPARALRRPLGDRVRRLTGSSASPRPGSRGPSALSPAMLSQLASARRVKIGDPAVLARLQLLDRRCAAGPPPRGGPRSTRCSTEVAGARLQWTGADSRRSRPRSRAASACPPRAHSAARTTPADALRAVAPPARLAAAAAALAPAFPELAGCSARRRPSPRDTAGPRLAAGAADRSW